MKILCKKQLLRAYGSHNRLSFALLRKTRCVFLLMGLFLLSPLSAQPPVKPPEKVWLSLGYSTLASNAPNWKWLRRQCNNGDIFNSLRPIAAKMSGLVIPVFADGQCFYATNIKLFKGRNLEESGDEHILRTLLLAARQAKVPVYLGIDVLNWQKTRLGETGSGVFKQDVALQEVNKDFTRLAHPEALYASPFNQQARQIMKDLVEEIAVKFPEADGLALNLRLSNQEILGYSAAARTASIDELGIDPLDLSLSGSADESINQMSQQWINWRGHNMMSLLKALEDSYRKSNPHGKMLINGVADYYVLRQLNTLRTGQDWMSWATNGLADGIILEGHWLPRYNDTNQLLRFASQFDDLERKIHHAPLLLPMLSGSGLVKEADYQKEWTNLKMRNESLQQAMLLVTNDADIKSVVALTSGDMLLAPRPKAEISGLAPEWNMVDEKGNAWDSRDLRGQHDSWLLLDGDAPTAQPTLAALEMATANTLKVKVFLVSSRPVAHGPETVNLLDRRGELRLGFEASPSLIAVDKAGFIRVAQPLPISATLPLTESELTPKLEIGYPAPDFAVVDMDGRVIRPAAFRGKNLLLTFFPRSFTTGCANQLKSLRQEQEVFKANNIEVLAISVDPADTQREFAKSLDLEFSLVPDPGRNLCILYQATHNNRELAARESVLIDRDGIVRLIDRGVKPATHGEDILAKMRELRLIHDANEGMASNN